MTIFSGMGIAIWNQGSLLIVYQATYVRASIFYVIISDFSYNALSYDYAKQGENPSKKKNTIIVLVVITVMELAAYNGPASQWTRL